jgi:hypothetical protein
MVYIYEGPSDSRKISLSLVFWLVVDALLRSSSCYFAFACINAYLNSALNSYQLF